MVGSRFWNTTAQLNNRPGTTLASTHKMSPSPVGGAHFVPYMTQSLMDGIFVWKPSRRSWEKVVHKLSASPMAYLFAGIS